MHRLHLITAATFDALMATTTLSQAQTAAPAGQPAEASEPAAKQGEPTATAATATTPARTGDIRSIVLFSGGVAEIVRAANVSGEATVGMEVPLDQVNDVLKSLVVRNPGGTVGQAADEALRGVDHDDGAARRHRVRKGVQPAAPRDQLAPQPVVQDVGHPRRTASGP